MVLKRLAPVVLAVGCKGPTVEPEHRTPAPESAATAVAPSEQPSNEPKQLGQFTITFYYVIGEEEVAPKLDVANENSGDDRDFAATTGDDSVTLYEADQCEAIAQVSPEFATQLAIQGTGKLRDGRVLNIWGRCACARTPCFKVTSNQWGNSGTGRPLQPFRTVAVDPKVVPLGSLLYVPLLEGRTMPGRAPWGGFVHDGCVVADDTGGHIDGNRLDLFVARKGYYLGLSGSQSSHAWARHVPVYDGSKICERKGKKVGRKTGGV
ncbi:MAG TPA: 3D domain-containing protein [Kofleriaceae bacterium]|nr:3D domain-containing protein [Kofleriaceae bacterium]